MNPAECVLVILEKDIPVFVEQEPDLETAKKAAEEIVADYFRSGPKDWSPKGRVRAHVWSFMQGQIVWSKGYR